MGEYWTGASGDNSHIRRNLWRLYLLGYFGPPVLGWENSNSGGIPPNAAPTIDRFWRLLEDQTEALLRQHIDETEALTHALLAKGSLTNKEIMEYLGDNGWQQTDTAFPQWREAEPPALPSGALLPLPAPAPVEAAPVASVPATTAVSASATQIQNTASAGVRMMPPPKPEDFARRRPPATPEPEKPVEPAKPAEQTKNP